MRHYCLGECSAPSVCARHSRPVLGAQAGTWCCVPPVSPLAPRVSRAVCGWPSRPGVPYPRLLVRHCTRSVRSVGSVRLPFWSSPRALCVCVRSRSCGVRFPPSPPLAGVVRAPRAVPALGAGRAGPRGPCPCVSFPGPLYRLACLGGGGPVPSPPYLAWGCAPPWGGSAHPGRSRAGGWGGWGGGGASCALRPPFVRPGRPVGRGVTLPCSVPLPSLGRQQSGCHWRRSRHGGSGPHTAPVRGRLPSLGAAYVAP